jgi:hypothetical protein
MKLMQSLNKIENKLDKESGSRKSGSHKSPNEKRRTRSVRRHHHHSLRNSNRRAPSSSSPSPVRKHTKRAGMDKIQGEMNIIKPPTFYGEHKKDEDADTWMLGMRNYFKLHNCSSHIAGRIAIYHLKEKTSMWWDHLV